MVCFCFAFVHELFVFVFFFSFVTPGARPTPAPNININIIIDNYFESGKEAFGFEFGAPASPIVTGIGYDNGLLCTIESSNVALFATHISQFEAPLDASFTTFNGDIE